MIPLPIDEWLPRIVEHLAESPNILIDAEPGAGKTTRIPAAILKADFSRGKEVWVLEPRRIAARLSAKRVADELGEKLGETVGYQVRFDEVASSRTRLRFLTEGILTRRLVGNPQLKGVAAVILDEFHERHLQSDVALALLRRLQLTHRPDLRIVVMSATLETEGLQSFLGSCPIVRCAGQKFNVSLDYREDIQQTETAARVAKALPLMLESTAGDILVFLPGAADIRRTQASCKAVADRGACVMLPLHGDMSAAEQDEVVRPWRERRIILTTNVAETSLTIEGVTGVIDSGLARKAFHQPWSGIQSLTVERISRASAVQRAGRAGRVSDGQCIRLYSEMDFSLRPAFEIPEIQRLDVSGIVLELAALGYPDPRKFDWFEAPSEAALESAVTLLYRLGAISPMGVITEIGREMARLPTHPRLARLLVEGVRRSSGREGALVASLLGERSLRSVSFTGGRAARGTSANILSMVDLYQVAASARFDVERLAGLGISPGGARSVDSAMRQYLRLTGSGGLDRGFEELDEREMRIALLAGFPDRVARFLRNDDGHRKSRIYQLSGERTVFLESSEEGPTADFIVVAMAEEETRQAAGKPARTVVRAYGQVEPEWLFDYHPDYISEDVEVRWNSRLERVETSSVLLYDSLIIESSPVDSSRTSEKAGQLLFEEARRRGLENFLDERVRESLLPRLAFLGRLRPGNEWPIINDEFISERLALACRNCTSFNDLKQHLKFETCLREWLPAAQARELERIAPEHIALPHRKRVPVNYPPGGDPFISSRIQDFFGMEAVPQISGTPLLVHLLAPSNRPLQVTRDLKGFWERLYPSLRRELMRKYPRHKWPEDPLNPGSMGEKSR